jgi:hypothetical protein
MDILHHQDYWRHFVFSSHWDATLLDHPRLN